VVTPGIYVDRLVACPSRPVHETREAEA